MQTAVQPHLGRIFASGTTDRGTVRPTNEDCFGIDKRLQLLVIADGMGGHNAGEVAARIVVDSILDFVANRSVSTTWPYGYDSHLSLAANLLRTAVQIANLRVFEVGASSPDLAGMGTTVVAVLVRDQVATIAHVGDSRAYAVHAHQVCQLTTDDSWTAAMLARDPSISPEILRRHPMRNALTSVVGSRPTVEVHVQERELADDELLVLTTDGVHGVLDERDLVRTCELAMDLESVAAGLVQAALDNGSRDNCTAVAARFAPS